MSEIDQSGAQRESHAMTVDRESSVLMEVLDILQHFLHRIDRIEEYRNCQENIWVVGYLVHPFPKSFRLSALDKVRGDRRGESARMGLEEWPARNLGRGQWGVDAA